MDHMHYNRVIGRRCYGMRGFKLNPRKFSVQRLRVKFLYLFKIFRKSWKSSYGHVINLLKIKNVSARKQRDESYGCSSTRSLVTRKQADYAMYGNRSDYRLKTFTRSNSFYAEAIADCLDFIKRNSLSMEEKPVLSHES